MIIGFKRFSCLVLFRSDEAGLQNQAGYYVTLLCCQLPQKNGTRITAEKTGICTSKICRPL